MFLVEWTQHAAGHGGFHSGRAKTDLEPSFNWAFDCGSQSAGKMKKMLATWLARNQEPLRWLFISHFDTDHVNGVETLLSRSLVHDVMVPYVNDREIAFQLLYEIDRGNLERSLFELAADPANFFLQRGAERVTFLGEGQRPGAEPDTRPSGPDRPEDQAGWRTKISPQPTPMPSPTRAQGSARANSRVLLVKSPCEIIAVNGPVGLRFKAYRSPIARNAHRGLISALESVVGQAAQSLGRPGLGELAFAMALHARTATGRKAFQGVFAKYSGSSNRSSLSLLSSPLLPDKWPSYWKVSHPETMNFGGGSVAWMNTGDAELLKAADLRPWQNHYRNDLANVQVLALPHHGSDKNSNDALQNLCPSAVLVAHARSGARKHPGLDVSSFAGERLAVVTEEPGTALYMRFWAAYP